MEDTAIRTRKIKVRELLDYVNEGKFAIPKLQREFVWDGTKAVRAGEKEQHFSRFYEQQAA
jgi:hypothetical protein